MKIVDIAILTNTLRSCALRNSHRAFLERPPYQNLSRRLFMRSSNAANRFVLKRSTFCQWTISTKRPVNDTFVESVGTGCDSECALSPLKHNTKFLAARNDFHVLLHWVEFTLINCRFHLIIQFTRSKRVMCSVKSVILSVPWLLHRAVPGDGVESC